MRNYMSHVTQFYIQKGHPKKSLNSPLQKAVLSGIKRCMPSKADSRVAFLLVHYDFPTHMKNSRSITVKKAIAAMSLGFFAMLRFHSYQKFCLENLTLVLKGGKEVTPLVVGRKIVLNLLTSMSVVGFYFTFDDKFHPGARAYYCMVSDLHRNLRRVCPLRQLQIILQISHNDSFFLNLRSQELC